MKSKTLRTITVLSVIGIITVGFFTDWGIGTLSAPGIFDISLLCPLGALTTMLATKMVLPRGVVSLIIMVILIIVFARAFCGWICPIPLVSKLRDIFKKNPKAKGDLDTQASEGTKAIDGVSASEGEALDETIPLTNEEKAAVTSACEKPTKGKTACATCAKKRGDALDARHFVLGGALISTFAFGFPVFCLVCPIGLTFATIFLVINLFTNGAVTWTLIFVPALLAVEVIFFRKWCHKLCPLSAFMSLIAKANKTFVPTIDNSKCLETAQGIKCGKCSKSCEEGIDPRHYAQGEAAWNECTKCRECVDVCPTGAISMPFLPRRKKVEAQKPIDITKDEA